MFRIRALVRPVIVTFCVAPFASQMPWVVPVAANCGWKAAVKVESNKALTVAEGTPPTQSPAVAQSTPTFFHAEVVVSAPKAVGTASNEARAEARGSERRAVDRMRGFIVRGFYGGEGECLRWLFNASFGNYGYNLE